MKPQDYELKEYLRCINVRELTSKIRKFRTLQFSRMSRPEIAQAILDVLFFRTPQGERAILPMNYRAYPVGTRFYRVRTLSPTDRSIPLEGMRVEADAWWPPAERVGLGRVNSANEPLLYVSPLPRTAIEELKIKDGERFSLIVYEAMTQVRVIPIGDTHIMQGFLEEEELKIELLFDFLAHEFMRDVGVGTEYLYYISEIIAKSYYDLPPDQQNAWCYPSVASRQDWNLCFRPEMAKKCLSLIGVLTAVADRSEGQLRLMIEHVASGFDERGIFVYHDIGSDEQKRLFPDF